MNKKRKLKHTICIVCEGKNTEPNYFERIKEDVMSKELAINIHLHDTDKTDPIGLMEEALSIYTEYDEIWAVFDKNGYTKHNEVFDNTRYKNINIAFSSISFEQWILLHFEKSLKHYGKSKDIENHLISNNYITNYSKKKDFDVYPYLKSLTKIAICNSAGGICQHS